MGLRVVKALGGSMQKLVDKAKIVKVYVGVRAVVGRSEPFIEGHYKVVAEKLYSYVLNESIGRKNWEYLYVKFEGYYKYVRYIVNFLRERGVRLRKGRYKNRIKILF